jgi:pre-mRNA-splicing helicase BRR2
MYGAGDARADDKALLQRRIDLAHSAALLLDKHNLIRYDRRGGVFQTTALGRVASHYYVTHATIASFNAFLKPTISDLDLFRLFSLSSEFKNIIVRPDEKEELRKLLDRVPVPVKESVEEPSAKVNVLLQAYISRLPLDGLALSADMIYVHQSAARLTRAIFEICLRRGWAVLARRALELSKMVDHRQWATASPLRQFSAAQGGLTEETLRKLEKKDLPWSRYYDLSPGDLGEMVRLAKLGKPLHRLVHSIPRLEVSAHVAPITRSLLRIDVTLTPDFVFDSKIHGGSENFWVFVEDADGDVILHAELFSLKARYAEEDHILTFTLPLTEPMPPHYFLRVLSDRWLHSETVLPISFSSLILPSKFAPHTELLDLAPLPVSALRVPEYQALFTSGSVGDSPSSRLRVFNPVQTQTFSALYESDANVLVSAPSGSGKTVCAEFALLRLFSHEPNARAVYIAPLASLARERFEDWEVRFGRGLGKAVVELTGELTSDLKLIERAHIVISTPSQWDAISRRWKKRRIVQDVRLYICDELQMIGAIESGPTYEVVVLRMRFSAAAMSGGPNPRVPARIVALASSVANSRDLCEWIGASPTGSFAFHPAARSVPLEVRVQGFEVSNFSARILAMARPAYAACASAVSTPGRSALIFVPSRKQAQLTAIDLISFAAAEGKTDRFVRGRASATAIEAALTAAGVEDAALATCLRAGVGYTYEGQRAGERMLVERLFQSGVLGVAVAPAVAAWGMGSSTWGAHLVVIMGTESYDGRVHSQVDYPLTDVLRMTGRACRVARGTNGEDLPARCVLLCASNRKEYLKKFLYEPLPLESHLNLALHDHFAAEIVNRIMETKQDALDYLTWTFLYRRLTQNPNYYNLTGTSNRHVSDFLSDLVDSTVGDLAASQCIAVEEDEMTLTPLNLGLIASYYYVGYTTLEVFASSLTAKTKMRGVIEILSNAAEFSSLALRHGEDRTMRNLSAHVPLALPPLPDGVPVASQYNLPHVKANLLLQAHFSRRGLSAELAGDFSRIADRSITLLQAMVDVISSEGWLKPALAAMEVSQMLVQGLWVDRDSPLQQVPHITRDIADALGALDPPVESVFDLAALDGSVRSRVLGLGAAALSDVARFCNRYPSIDVAFDIEGALEGTAAVRIAPGESIAMSVTLTREAGADGMEEGAGLGAVYAPRFPHAKSEAWWVVIGSTSTNTLAAIKRVAFADTIRVKLDFPSPPDAGSHKYKLFIVSDSYIGCDQEYEISLDVGE